MVNKIQKCPARSQDPAGPKTSSENHLCVTKNFGLTREVKNHRWYTTHNHIFNNKKCSQKQKIIFVFQAGE